MGRGITAWRHKAGMFWRQGGRDERRVTPEYKYMYIYVYIDIDLYIYIVEVLQTISGWRQGLERKLCSAAGGGEKSTGLTSFQLRFKIA